MAIPSPSYFPTSLSERAAWVSNSTLKFTALAPSLGFLSADVTAVQADN